MQEDWLFLWAAADEMEEYLLSSVIFWPLETKKGNTKLGQLPPLTLGNVCLARRRLSVSTQIIAQPEVRECLQKIDDTRSRWRSNWALKAEHEYSERLRLWMNYCNDKLTGEMSAVEYSSNVRQRVILELLEDEMLKKVEHEEKRLSQLDGMVQVFTSEGEFIWDSQFMPTFPKGRFWFLYRNLSRERK